MRCGGGEFRRLSPRHSDGAFVDDVDIIGREAQNIFPSLLEIEIHRELALLARLECDAGEAQ